MPADLLSVADQLAELTQAARNEEITDAFVVYRMTDGSFNYCFNTSDVRGLHEACSHALAHAAEDQDSQPARLH